MTADEPTNDCVDKRGRPCHWEKDKVSGNGWDEWRRLVLGELKRLSGEVRAIREEQNTMGKQLAALRVKSGVWGAVGACIPIAILLAIQILNGG